MKATKLSGAVVALVLAFAAGFWFREFLDIDRCLDRGGMWDPDKALCIAERNGQN